VTSVLTCSINDQRVLVTATCPATAAAAGGGAGGGCRGDYLSW